MSKLSIIAAAALATTVAASAASPFQGVYGGAKLGQSSNKIDSSTTVVATGIKTPSSNHSATGLAGGVFVGYRQMFDNFAVGAEGGFNLENSSVSNLPKTNSSNVATPFKSEKAGNSWDLVATFGTTLTPKSLAFVKAGIRSQKLTYNAVGTAASKTQSANKTGFLMGLGADIQVADQVLVRGEYTHNFGATINDNSVAATAGKAKFTSDAALVGVVYKIG